MVLKLTTIKLSSSIERLHVSSLAELFRIIIKNYNILKYAILLHQNFLWASSSIHLYGSSTGLCKNPAVIEQKVQVKNAKFCLWWPNQKYDSVSPLISRLVFPLDYVYWIKLNQRMKGSVHDTLIMFTWLEENQSHWVLLRYFLTPILHTRKCCLASVTQALPLFKGVVQDSREEKKKRNVSLWRKVF